MAQPRRGSWNTRLRGPRYGVHPPLWLLLALAIGGGGFSGFAQLQREGQRQEPKWEVLTGCRLMTNATVDGDSFHVLHKQREYIFRLYFVDSPESDPAMKDRIKDQSEYFGILPKDIPRAGLLASRFTREKLTGRDFTIITRWQNALGRSSLARFYGVVLIGGTNLAEELVANGYARIHGLRANWPDGPRSTTFINKLKNLELIARENKRGVWDEAAFPRQTGEMSSTDGSTNPVPANASVAPTALDVNTATYEELQKLPGIGPKLAERIIAHRPFKSIGDLDRVPGIGPATIKRLESLILVTTPPP